MTQALCSTVTLMITKIEIDGYKGFENFSMEFSPFTVIAGVNGVGKSNLFDAFRHVSKLVSSTLVEAFATDRGSYEELFTLFPSGHRRETIRYNIEMLMPGTVTDQFSDRAVLKNLRLRYEIEIRLEQHRKFMVEHEKLTYIKKSSDIYIKSNKEAANALPKSSKGRQTPFIDTEKSRITISQDGNAGGKRVVSREGAQRTVLSSITTVEFPHAYAARKMLENIHFLQLNPEKLRTPSKFTAAQSLTADGENLAAVIARLIDEDEDVEQMISNDLASVIPGVASFYIKRSQTTEEFVIGIRHIDGYEVPSKLLSDGTLRILALITIRYDPEFNGLIILEEPENGVHPGRIPHVISLLKDMTSLPNSSGSYKQVIANSHSKEVIKYIRDSLVFATPERVTNRYGPHTVTRVRHADDTLFGFQARQELEDMLDSKIAPDEDQLVL